MPDQILFEDIKSLYYSLSLSKGILVHSSTTMGSSLGVFDLMTVSFGIVV